MSALPPAAEEHLARVPDGEVGLVERELQWMRPLLSDEARRVQSARRIAEAIAVAVYGLPRRER